MDTRVVNFTKTGKPATHGTGTNYNRGCRCEPCVLFNRERGANTKKRLEREMQEGLKKPEHGVKSTYVNYGCRCEPCKKAHADALREQQTSRVQRMKAAGWSLKGVEHGTRTAYTAWGCRCEPCTEAATEVANTYRDELREKIKTGDYEIKKHGTSTGYNLGCRCGECKARKREMDTQRRQKETPLQRQNRVEAIKTSRDRRRKQLASGELEIEHGTNSSYTGYRCRCEPCKEANSVYQKAYRERKKAERATLQERS